MVCPFKGSWHLLLLRKILPNCAPTRNAVKRGTLVFYLYAFRTYSVTLISSHIPFICISISPLSWGKWQPDTGPKCPEMSHLKKDRRAHMSYSNSLSQAASPSSSVQGDAPGDWFLPGVQMCSCVHIRATSIWTCSWQGAGGSLRYESRGEAIACLLLPELWEQDTFSQQSAWGAWARPPHLDVPTHTSVSWEPHRCRESWEMTQAGSRGQQLPRPVQCSVSQSWDRNLAGLEPVHPFLEASLLPSVVGWITSSVPKEVLTLILGTCEYVTLNGKRDFAGGT